MHFAHVNLEVTCMGFLELCGEVFDGEIPLWTECSNASHSLIMPGCGSIYLFSPALGGMFSDDGWAKH